MKRQKRVRFESGIFWELYIDLERQFQSFLEYVPYLKGNEKTYSFKLLNLILSIGGYVDSAFKEMAFYRGKFYFHEHFKEIRKLVRKKRTVPITLPLEAFEKKYRLSTRTVVFKCLPERENVKPFQPFRTIAPEWWSFYNDLKHDVSLNIKKANLKNTRDALTGAFLLNVIHTPAALRLCEYGVTRLALKTKKGRISGQFGSPKPWILKAALEKGKGIAGAYVETPLFVYDYDQ